jgi:hypothetical protein
MKLGNTECFETSAFKLQTPVDHPEESIRNTLFCPRYDLLIHHLTSRQIFAGNHMKTMIKVKHVSDKTVGGISIFVTLIFTM